MPFMLLYVTLPQLQCDLGERLEYTGQGRDEEVGFICVGTEAIVPAG